LGEACAARAPDRLAQSFWRLVPFSSRQGYLDGQLLSRSCQSGPIFKRLRGAALLTAILLKAHCFQIDERSKFQTQKGLIFGLV
jgi:hypothetical protein